MHGKKGNRVMLLEEPDLSEETLKEMANVYGVANILHDHPEVKVEDALQSSYLAKSVVRICLLLVLFVSILCRYILRHGLKQGIWVLLLGLLLLFFLIAFEYYSFIYQHLATRKTYRNLLKMQLGPTKRAKFLLDDEGAFMQFDGKKVRGIRWDGLAFVRFFPNCIIFFPRELHGTLIMLSKFNELPIREFLSTYHSEIPIY